MKALEAGESPAADASGELVPTTIATNIFAETYVMRIARRCVVLAVLLCCAGRVAAEFQFRDQELPTKLTVGYAVRLLDMNDDERLDICDRR